MREVKAKLREMLRASPADAIVDAPPGVSCPAINAVMDADVIVLVTEPTPFGLYDLQLAHEAFAPLNKPMGIVINRAGLGETAVFDFCRSRSLPIWAEIPFSTEIAAAYSRGEIVAGVSPQLRSLFIALAQRIEEASGAPAGENHA
jgi:MinD superfamily P-loop ATPase